MAVWCTSDWHLYDPDIIHRERRPFPSLVAMHEALIKRWNARVHRGDLGLHLGDVVSMGYTGTAADVVAVIGRLHGRKLLIPGNHDRDRDDTWWLACGFAGVVAQPLQVFSLAFTHEPVSALPAGVVNVHGHVHD